MALRFLLLFVLTALSFGAALSATARLRLESRAEKLLAAVLLWNLLILVPIHALGVLDVLFPWSLAVGSVVASAAAFALSAQGVDRRAHARDVRRTLVEIARIPMDAISLSLRARSPALLVVAGAIALLAWSAFQTYVLPSDHWDGIWYHDTIVGYTIQNHGYRPADLPMNLTQQANGFPRNCEMTGLWFVIFTDRRLIEIPNVILAVPLLASTYLLCQRYHPDKLVSMSFAGALLLFPGAALQLRSTYIDVSVAAYLLAAIHFCTRTTLRVRDGWMCGVALALLLGTKGMALYSVPVLALLAAIRLSVQQLRARPLAVLGTIVGCAALIVASGAVTYLGNYLHFGNPIWPFRYANAELGIQWPGVVPFASVDVNRPLSAMVRAMTQPPVPGHDYADTRVYGYGIIVPLVLLPLSAVAVLVAILVAAAALVQRAFGFRSAIGERVWNLLLVTAFMLFTARMSPALWSARYNVHLVAGMFCAVTWLAGLLRSRRGAEAIAVAAALFHAVSLYWCDPPIGGLSVGRTLAVSRLPAKERAVRSPLRAIAPEVARAREAELGPGTLVVYSDDIVFPSLLWNERFTNRVAYVAGAPPAKMARRIDALGPSWLVTRERGPLWWIVQAEPDRWEQIGLASLPYHVLAFRRKR